MSTITRRVAGSKWLAGTERLIGRRPQTRGGRLLWFLGLYVAGVVVTVGVASVLRAILVP